MSRGKARRSLELIEACHEILAEIQPASVRAVCYRCFVLRLISSMTKTDTNRVSRLLTDARESGRIPWAWIVDETRGVEAVSTWADPAAFAETVTRAYRRTKWDVQPTRVEVWSEKGTVRGTLAPVLNAYEVPFRVMHGYASATAVQDVVRAALDDAATPLHVFYVGDHDPSGLHMSEEDLPRRLFEYRMRELAARGLGLDAGVVTMERLALTSDDTEALGDRLAFDADTRTRTRRGHGDPRERWYVEHYGRLCWELDALSPVVLRERVEATIRGRLDMAAWTRYVEAERLERDSIEATVRTWRGLEVVERAP